MSTLIDLSRKKEIESKSREETVDEINDEGGNKENKEFDSVNNHNDDDTDIDQEGGRGVASNNDTKNAVELNCVDEKKSEGNKEIKDNNNGHHSVDKEGGRSFADNNDGNNSTITKWATTISATVKVVPTKEKSYHLEN